MHVHLQGLSGSRALLLNRNYTEDTQFMVPSLHKLVIAHVAAVDFCGGPAAYAAECSDLRKYDISASCQQLTSNGHSPLFEESATACSIARFS